jgi:uncharacterized protein YdaL
MPDSVNPAFPPLLISASLTQVPISTLSQRARRRRNCLAIALLWFTAFAVAPRCSRGAQPASTTNTVLVLYDSSGAFGWIGELDSILLGNLLGHFPLPSQKAPVEQYHAGDIDKFRMIFYIGSIFDNLLPEAFLEDVMSTTKTVCWMKYNLWRLGQGTLYGAAFESKFGFHFEFMDSSGYTNVQYKGETLSRHPADVELGRTTILNSMIAQAQATAWRDSESNAIPYILHASNFWYVADVPFSYISEEDRYLAFADLLHDMVGIDHPESHRAIIRLEDVAPSYPPELLHAAADYLASERVPFCVATVPVYADPLGYYHGGEAVRIEMADAPQFVEALKYVIGRGAQLVMHGYTHQYNAVPNPFTGATGDDYEFFRVTYDAQTNLVDYAPVPEDSPQWAQARIRAGLQQFQHARLTPVAWETPHYAASAVDYSVFADNFSLTIQRALYFDASGHVAGQFFPYVIERDVYGQKIIPENLGNVDPASWYFYPARLPEDLIRAARRNRVVRDGWASAFFHPYLDLAYLRELVQGIKALGYTYVPLSDSVAPTIVQEAQSAIALIGTNMVFGVEAVGSGTLRYQWRHNGGVISGATNFLFSIPVVRPLDAGVYSVDVSNNFGTTTSIDAILTVFVPPLRIHNTNGIALTFSATPDVTYVIEYKSLSDTGWNTLITATGVSGDVTVPDSSADAQFMRLYRLRAE